MDTTLYTSAVGSSSSVLRPEAPEFMPQIQVKEERRDSKEGISAECLEEVTEPSSASSSVSSPVSDEQDRETTILES